MRVLSALAICLSYSGDPSEIGLFVILSTLFQVLFSLQGSLLAEGDSEGASYVQNLINGVTRVGREGIDASLLMQQYGVQLRSEADVQAVLDCVINQQCPFTTARPQHHFGPFPPTPPVV